MTAIHPLDPLSPGEILAAVAVVKADARFHPGVRFISVNLREPSKELVLAFIQGTAWEREAFLVLLDNSTGCVYEAVVSIVDRAVLAWTHIPGVQPSLTLDEFFECEQAVKANPEFRQALIRRGIHYFDDIMVDPWSAGNYGDAVENTHRIARAVALVREFPGDNGYAHPIDGLTVIVDLNRMEVLSVDDYGVIPVPAQPGNYTLESKGVRRDLKPIEITQPQGPSFTVEGHEVGWQKWRFRVGFNGREGLVLHTVSYEDQGRERPILYRAALSEMVVPYGDTSVTQYRKNAFDVGEYGVGMLANSLILGCDCLGHIHYFDAALASSRGESVVIPNAVCMHEEDFGILWKHTDWRTGQVEVRRSRRLVISFIATVGNYEYGVFWYLYQDGTIQLEIKLTGIMATGAVLPGQKSKFGQTLAPGLYAPNHQHIFNVRLDMMVDGENNSIYETNTSSAADEENPFCNAFFAESTLLSTERAAQRTIDPLRCRTWKVVNPSVRNKVGEPVGYKIVPGENALPFGDPETSVMKRAGFAFKHLWVTPYHPRELYAAGEYPNQHPGGGGLPEWTAKNRPIENTDIVVWYTMNHHHIPRLEDWPVMPTGYIGFSLKPVGFFDQSPALDVPPSAKALNACCH